MALGRGDIDAAVADLLAEAGMSADAARRGPVPLDAIFAETQCIHVCLPRLTFRAIANNIGRFDLMFGDPDARLAGFVVCWKSRRGATQGKAFVSSDDPVPRRRFTAAHELGHFVMHQDRMNGGCHADGHDEMDRSEEEIEDADAMEVEANRFAAVLLMPEVVLRARAEEFETEFGCCPRAALAAHVSAELLVSREALLYRLKELRLGHD